MQFRLERVNYMPKELAPGVLYYSEEFCTCAHLCACGCGSKIRTPIGPTEWTLTQTKQGPTLYPSIGNWQLECRSHYFITDGAVEWASQWTEEEVLAGRRAEQVYRESYYGKGRQQKPELINRLWAWFSDIFRK